MRQEAWDTIHEDWISSDELLKQTGLTPKEAEEKEYWGFFMRSRISEDLGKSFKDSVFSQESIDMYHEGKEAVPMKAKKHRGALEAGENKREAEIAAKAALEANKFNVEQLQRLVNEKNAMLKKFNIKQ